MADICPIGWFEIHVTDFDKAKDFYGELFGWEFKRMEGGDFEYWTIFTGEDSIGGGFMKKDLWKLLQWLIILITGSI